MTWLAESLEWMGPHDAPVELEIRPPAAAGDLPGLDFEVDGLRTGVHTEPRRATLVVSTGVSHVLGV